MRKTVAKRLRKDVYVQMKYSSVVGIQEARKQPKFKQIYRRRKKNYTAGKLTTSQVLAATELIADK